MAWMEASLHGLAEVRLLVGRGIGTNEMWGPEERRADAWCQLTSTWQSPLEDAHNNYAYLRPVSVSAVLLLYTGNY